jgi:hypothetical protein
MAQHAFTDWLPRAREGLTWLNRRGMLKASLAGIAGLTLADLNRSRALAAANGQSTPSRKSVILLWMAGGPSHIDTWDPKPDRPAENRGPFDTIKTRIPGVYICEHLPKQAAMLDKFTLIRSVDCRKSNHQPNKVMQTGHRDAAPRVNPNADRIPSIASIVAKHHGANLAGMAPYVAFQTDPTHVGMAGILGQEFNPFIAQDAARLPLYTDVGVDTGRVSSPNLFSLPAGISADRIRRRTSLAQQIDQLKSNMDASGAMTSLDQYSVQAVEMIAGSRARDAFDIQQEPESVRQRYGDHLWLQQALLARRLVEAGVSFVTLDLSHHRASGTWDTHGDNIPPYGGIKNGLGPLLPLFDHLITTLVSDLEERGLLDETLVIAMGEFGRTPKIGTQDSSDGRDHWPVVMSMCLAGGRMNHGQVIGESERDGGQIKSRPVAPSDLAATIYRHMGVSLDTTYLDGRGRPHYAVQEGGRPIEELF